MYTMRMSDLTAEDLHAATGIEWTSGWRSWEPANPSPLVRVEVWDEGSSALDSDARVTIRFGSREFGSSYEVSAGYLEQARDAITEALRVYHALVGMGIAPATEPIVYGLIFSPKE